VKEKLLPLGTVVKLKNKERMVNIIGYFHNTYENKSLKINEYTGIDYAKGFKKDSEILYFDENEIENIYFMGYINQGTKKILEILHEIYKEITTNSNTLETIIDKIGQKYYKDDTEEFEKLKEKYFNIKEVDSGVNK